MITKIYPINNISFKAGITTLYSDFDGTYMPSRPDMLRKNPEVAVRFGAIYGKFKNFIDKGGNNFQFIITTGNTRSETNYLFGKAKENGYDIPLPDKLITCEGGDIFLREQDSFPEHTKDLKKAELLENILCWDSNSIQQNLEKLASKLKNVEGKQAEIIKVGLNSREKDGVDISLEHFLKTTPLSTFVSFNKERNYQPYIAFSNDLNLKEVQKEVSQYFNRKGLNVEIISKETDYNLPESCSKSIEIRPKALKGDYTGKTITKLIDTKAAVKKIVEEKSNDLIVVAGDGENDKEMLNIFNYVDLFGVTTPDKSEYDNFLKSKKNRDIVKKIPLVSVMAGYSPHLKLIREISSLLEKHGLNKYIQVGYPYSGNLLNGVKEAINIHSRGNEKFKKGLTPKIIQELSQKTNLLLPSYPADGSLEHKQWKNILKNMLNKSEDLNWLDENSIVTNNNVLKFTDGILMALGYNHKKIENYDKLMKMELLEMELSKVDFVGNVMKGLGRIR